MTGGPDISQPPLFPDPYHMAFFRDANNIIYLSKAML